MTTLVATMLLGVGAALAMVLVERRGSRGPRDAVAALLGLWLVLAVLARLYEGPPEPELARAALPFAALGAVCGGNLVTKAVFGRVDGTDSAAARSALPGGAWIGAFERFAVFVCLVAGIPEGVAVVLAVKGLGRYPELRIAEARTDASGAGERFIIGTLVSLIWAAGAAYLALRS
ncbi:MAG: hypothetical protein M3419_02010 [Actinomycetota bacterium]|nr:hypothetical protein [Actinomycetota bacterium]